jgi:outer membrane protein TolC
MKLAAHKILFLFGFFCIYSELKAETFSEQDLVKAFLNSETVLTDQKVQTLRAQETLDASQTPYRAKLNAHVQALGSTKDAASAFQPSLESSQSWGIDIEKTWQHGIRSRVGFESTYSNLKLNPNPIQNHEPQFFIEASLSLYQNFLGNLDRALVGQAQLQSEISQIQQKMKLHQDLMAIRSLYWSLIANDLSIQIARSLLAASQEQLADIRKRRQSAVAEETEVLLSQAQVSQREAALLSLQLKEQGLLRELKKTIPSLSEYKLKFPIIDIPQMLTLTGECIAAIKTHSQTPETYSLYSELLPKLEQLSEQQGVSATQGLGPELTLMARLENNGIDNSFSEAFSESMGTQQNTWSVGLKLQIPLEKSEYRLKKARQKIAELTQKNAKNELANLLLATHETALLSLDFLQSTMKELDATTRFLKARIKSVEQKYKQGRVDFLNLVQEQDQLFNAENGLIESRLIFLHEILAYLSVFNKTPCTFNMLYAEKTPL